MALIRNRSNKESNSNKEQVDNVPVVRIGVFVSRAAMQLLLDRSGEHPRPVDE
jgi:hypothetical protein